MRVTGGGGSGGGGNTPHDLLDGNIDQDTVATTVVKGMIVIGNATPKWGALAIGAAGLALLVSSGLPAWGVLGVAGGGTGNATYATGDLLYASSSSALSRLAVSTDGFVLTLASGLPTWAAATGSGGANTALSNLAAVAVNLSLIAGTDNAIDLGSAAKRWRNLYLSTALQVLAAASDANATLSLSGSTVAFGPGGGTATDASIARTGTATLTVTGAVTVFTGDIANVSGGQISIFANNTDANPKFYVSPTEIAFGAGGSSATDVRLLRLAAGVWGLRNGNELRFQGLTSGYVGILPTATPTSYTITLPSAVAGAAGLPLVSTTGGVTSWTALAPTAGGTGITTYTTGDILYASTTNVLSKLAAGTDGFVLTLASGIPSWASVSGTGTVTSVAMSVPSFLAVSGSPVTTAGTLAVTLATQAANLVFAGPTSGGAAVPTFRALVNGDLPVVDATHGGTAQSTWTTGDILYASATNTLSKLAIGSTGQVLTVAGGLPSWATDSSSGGWTDDGTVVRLTTSTDNVTIGSATGGGKLFVDGDTDEKQLQVQGHSTQTSNLAEFQNSAGTSIVTIGPPTLPGNSTTINFLNVTGTLNSTPSAEQRGLLVSITSAGSTAQTQRAAQIFLNAGGTGNAYTLGCAIDNLTAGTGLGGAIELGLGNYGFGASSQGTAASMNVAGYCYAANGSTNVGLISVSYVAKNGATNIGVLGAALNTGTSPVQIGGFFGLTTTTPTLASAALMCDNGSTTSDIFVARDNATAKWSIIDGGYPVWAQIAGTATDGALWSDSTQKAFQSYVAGIEQTLSGVIFTQAADKTLTNSTSETTLFGSGVGTLTLPANFFAVGKTIRLTISGIYSTPVGASSIVINVKYGSTVIATVTTSALASLGSGLGFWGCVLITCRTTGATGTVEVGGSVVYAAGAAGATATDYLNNGGATTTIDTTASAKIDITGTWDAATTSRSVTSIVGTAEVLN